MQLGGRIKRGSKRVTNVHESITVQLAVFRKLKLLF